MALIPRLLRLAPLLPLLLPLGFLQVRKAVFDQCVDGDKSVGVDGVDVDLQFVGTLLIDRRLTPEGGRRNEEWGIRKEEGGRRQLY